MRIASGSADMAPVNGVTDKNSATAFSDKNQQQDFRTKALHTFTPNLTEPSLT